ncbi:MAG: tetratricopeptide repeat protein [bacterium]|nr:tetratricopeptide repeat protein [bacterium]
MRLLKNITIIILLFLVLPAAPGYTQISESNPDTRAYEHFTRGMMLEREGRLQEAVREFQSALEYENNHTIWKALGDLYIFKLRNYELGADSYVRFLEENPFDERTIDISLQIFMQLKRYGRAQNLLMDLIKKGNDLPRYYLIMTDLYLKDKKSADAQNTAVLYMRRTGQAQEACSQIADTFISNNMVIEGVEFFKSYIDDNPQDDNVGLILGRLEEARGNNTSAERAYLSVLRKNTLAHLARARLANLYLTSGRRDAAIELYNGIDFDDPTEIPVKIEVCRQMMGGEDPPWAQIEEMMKSVKNRQDVSKDVFYFLGVSQIQLNKLEEALENLREGYVLAPDDINIVFWLAQAEYALKLYNDALITVKKAIEMIPGSKDLFGLQGLIYDKLGDLDKAVESYETGLALDLVEGQGNDADASLYNNYSYLLSQRGIRLETALEMVRQALVTDPENSNYLDTLGWVYFKMGRLEEALEYTQKSLDQNDESAEVYDHMGDIYFQKEDVNKAREYWQKAVDLDSTLVEVKAKLEKK